MRRWAPRRLANCFPSRVPITPAATENSKAEKSARDEYTCQRLWIWGGRRRGQDRGRVCCCKRPRGVKVSEHALERLIELAGEGHLQGGRRREAGGIRSVSGK